MTSLLRLLRDRSDALEADLIERGVDLLDYWRGTLSLRRLLLLRRWLPEGSAVRRWERGTAWTVDQDIADWHRRDYAQVHGVEAPPPHPASPEARPKPVADRSAAFAAAKRRRDERARLIEAGDLT